jgi:hypothetical protein
MDPKDAAESAGLRPGIRLLVEEAYGVCGARDEPAHAGQQQQLVNQLDHDSPPPGATPAKPQPGAKTLVPRRRADLHQVDVRTNARLTSRDVREVPTSDLK